MLIVLKYGGNAMADVRGSDPLLDDVALRVSSGDRVVLVHGGGPQIDAALRERGIEGARVAGLRITDAPTLQVTENVLCGSVNKAVVRALLARGVCACGVSGQDGSLLVARFAAPVDGTSLGFVGEITRVNLPLLEALLAAGFVPVVAPLAVSEDASTALNVNADTAAGAIAGAVCADAYVVLTNVPRINRVRTDPSTALSRVTASEASTYMHDGTIDGGMKPKMESALDALRRGARSAIIAGSGPDALSRALQGDGTTVVPA